MTLSDMSATPPFQLNPKIFTNLQIKFEYNYNPLARILETYMMQPRNKHETDTKMQVQYSYQRST